MAFRKGLIPLRCELVDGTTQLAAVPDIEHATVCRAFKLDQMVKIEWPKSAEHQLSSSASRQIQALVFRHGDPIGKISIAYQGEERQFRDGDPTNRDDFFRLGYR